MSKKLNDNIKVQSSKPLDDKYGTYETTAAALAAINESFERHLGLTVGIVTDGVIDEYWFYEGIADENLVKKTGSINYWDRSGDDISYSLGAVTIGDGLIVTGISEGATYIDSSGLLRGLTLGSGLVYSAGELSLDSEILSQLHRKGLWDAATNSPAIPAASSANNGWFYIVQNSVAAGHGYANIPNVSYKAGDWVLSNGASWERVKNSAATNWVQNGNDVEYSGGNVYISGTISATGGNSTNWNTAYSDRISSLTTTGNSGVATLTSNVLNVPNYTLAGLGYTGATDANNYIHPTQSAISPTLSGALVLASLSINTLGHVTAATTRTLTLANLGYTGAANANYITNNNQLTNGAGYATLTTVNSNFISLFGSYANPSWITQLAYSKITGAPSIPTDFYSQSAIQNFFSGSTSITGYNRANWDTAYSNRISSLTTTGSSGAATLISNVLNIPNYTLIGLGGNDASNLTTGTLPDARLSANVSIVGHTHTFASLTSKPTTISGYGITDYNSLWDTRLATKSTSNLTEGTNLYYTTTRANSAVDSRVTQSFVNALNVNAATLGGVASSGFATASHVHSGSDITSGTVADDRLSSNVALKNVTNVFTADQRIQRGIDTTTAFGIRGLTKGLRLGTNSGFGTVEAVDQTLNASYQPLALRGSIVNIYGATTIDNSVTATSFSGSGSALTSLNASNILTGTLSVSRGGTGVGTLTGIAVGNGTSAMSAVSGTANQLLRRNSGNTAYEFFTPSYLTANQTITLSGDLSGSGTTSINATIASNAVEASMLNNNIVSGLTALTSGLASTDEIIVSDGGTIKRMDVSVLQSYMQSNLTGYLPLTGGTLTGTLNGINITASGSVSSSVSQSGIFELSGSNRITATTGATDLALNNYNQHRILLNSSTTISFTSWLPKGVEYTIILVQGTGGSKTVTWPSYVSWGSAGAPTLSTTAGKVDIITLIVHFVDASNFSFSAAYSLGHDEDPQTYIP